MKRMWLAVVLTALVFGMSAVAIADDERRPPPAAAQSAAPAAEAKPAEQPGGCMPGGGCCGVHRTGLSAGTRCPPSPVAPLLRFRPSCRARGRLGGATRADRSALLPGPPDRAWCGEPAGGRFRGRQRAQHELVHLQPLGPVGQQVQGALVERRRVVALELARKGGMVGELSVEAGQRAPEAALRRKRRPGHGLQKVESPSHGQAVDDLHRTRATGRRKRVEGQ